MLVGLALALAVRATADSPTRVAQAGTATQKTFTFRIPGEPETLDWSIAHTPVETYLLMNMMEGLVTYDQKLRVIPSLAESWQVSADGKTYTFKLAPFIKWSDGVPLKAQDFVYSWRRLLSPLTAASYAYLLFDVQGAREFNQGKLHNFADVGILAPDDRTLRVQLTHAVTNWIQYPTFWAMFPMREDVINLYGNDWAKPGRMQTVGPYVLDAYEADTKVVLKRNPFYSGQRGNVEQIVAQVISDDAVALRLYDSGKLDFLTDLGTLDVKQLSKRADFRTFPYLKTGYLGFSTSSYPVSSVHLRRAIAHAIDRQRIPEVLHGGQIAATSLIPPGIPGYEKKMGLAYDPFKAKREVKAAGLDGAHVFTLELLLPNWKKSLTLGQFIQEQLKKNLGLEIVLQPFDHRTFRASLDLHSHPLFEAFWAADYPTADNFLSVFMSDSGNNRLDWKNSAYDSFVRSGRDAKTDSAQIKAYELAQVLLIEEQASIVPLYYEPNSGLVKPRVSGLVLNALNYLYLKKVELK